MNGLLADVNIEGLVDAIVTLMQEEPWFFFWQQLGLRYVRFADVGLAHDATDAQVWQVCQDEHLHLITDNRNANVPDSLQATIESSNTPNSLPVFTIGDVQRLRRSKEYALRVVESLYGYFLEADNILGTGRLFLP